MSKVHNIKTNTDPRLFFLSRSRSLFLFSLFSVVFGLIGVMKTLVWRSCTCSVIAVISSIMFQTLSYILYTALKLYSCIDNILLFVGAHVCMSHQSSLNL